MVDIGASITRLAGQLEDTASLVCASPHDDSPIVAAEGARHLTRLLAAAVQSSMESIDPDYPQFFRPISPSVQYALPAVDCAYICAPVRGDNTYRIHGRVGSARLFHVETSAATFPHMDRWTRFDGKEEFDIGPDGEIDIILSRDKHDGNWIALPDGDEVGLVLVRQYFYDWDNEEPAQLNIERVGATYPPPPYTTERAEFGLELLHDFFDIVPPLCARAVERYYQSSEIIPFAPLAFGWKDLSYGTGHFRCEPGRAVILEFEPPESDYWAVQLMNHQWEAYDWHLRQSSLNGHQAVLDTDGVFRAVICHTDPGVANWLDPAGHPVGLIAIRHFRPKGGSPARLTTMPIEEVDAYLPVDTSRVSHSERQESLRRRMLSVRRRMCD